MLSKPSSIGGGESEPGRLPDPAFRERYPTLYEYLTLGRWEDATHRETATLTLFIEDGLVKLCLNDRACERTGWVTSGSALEALEALEGGLRADRLEWRGKPKGKPVTKKG